jgi:ribose/xylose/arabinose/galactoside ABC-type transport system permease subunit
LAAIGNSPDVASRLGIKVGQTMFLAFVLSGFLASVGGIVSIMVIGSVNTYIGLGLEFTAVAAVVMGGTSLFGGEGSVIPGTLVGVVTLITIENGLNLIGASPFLYPFVRGFIIFTAMYADSLKSQVRTQTRTVVPEAVTAGGDS